MARQRLTAGMFLALACVASITEAQVPAASEAWRASAVTAAAPAAPASPQAGPVAQVGPPTAQPNAVLPGVAEPPGALPTQAPPSAAPNAGPRPDQPVVPHDPSLQPRVTPQLVAAPFVLDAAQEAQLDRTLKEWEQASSRIKTFECKFIRLQFLVAPLIPNDPKFDPSKPVFQDEGEIRYGNPDRGMFRVDGERPEKWICDGKAIYEYRYTEKKIVEHRLPPELQGTAIADGPLPFLFGSSAAKLKQRYYLRLVTPQGMENRQIWLQAFPKFQQDSANFSRAELILNASDRLPSAVQLHLPNHDRHVYVLKDVVTNNLLGFLRGDAFKPSAGWGWQKVVEEVPSPRVSENPAAAPRR